MQNDVRGVIGMIDESKNEFEQETNAQNEEKLNEKKHSIPFVRTILGAIALGVIAGGVLVGIDTIKNKSIKIEDSTTQVESVDLKEEQSGVSQIVKNVKPAIVAISSRIRSVNYNLFNSPNISETNGQGSGIIIGQEGNLLYVVTNNHVIADASEIKLQFIDDVQVYATVKGAEPLSDLAIVSVDLRRLPSTTLKKIRIAALGNSSECEVGDLVVAIGNALGYGQSTTVGSISALEREVNVEKTTLNLFQTDAAINPGNSGGALLNAKGEVIGINSVKYVETDVEGVGYAIPISNAVPIINELLNREDLSDSERGQLGIGGRDVTEIDAKKLDLPIGVYINMVEPGSAADEAGLKIGDVITGISGKKIETKEELDSCLSYIRSKTKVTLTIQANENGKYVEKTVEVVLH